MFVLYLTVEIKIFYIMQIIPEYLSKHQLKKLIQHMPTVMMKDAAVVMYSYALRISELCSLQKSNVDWDNDVIRITGKGKVRDLPITDVTRQILGRACSRPGKLFNVEVRTFRNYIYLAAQRAEIGHCHPHMLRHSRATHLLNEGKDLADIKAVMRHENIASTIIYTHVAVDRLRVIMN